jgi:vanillate/3-O-methylgallate O-demethylase
MDHAALRETYRKANEYRKTPFLERPYFGSPGAPAQAENNASNIWGHINGGFLFAYEYTRWWKESRALRQTAILGDWSWLNKCIVSGSDALKLLNFASVKNIERIQIGQIMYTPMVSAEGKVAIEGLTLRLAEDEYMFTQSGALAWLTKVNSVANLKNVQIEDVTPDYTCFALQGPKAVEILEAVTGEPFADMRFSRWRKVPILGVDTIVARQGVTGEVGYEFMMPTSAGKGHELWAAIRDAGRNFGLRELGFKAQLVGHTETGIATVVRDFLPDRFPRASWKKFARLWTSQEELDALDWDITEQLCSPAELGWKHTINLDHDFYGREALQREADAGGPSRQLVGLIWNSDDMAELYARQFRDESAPPPPDLPYGQFRLSFQKVTKDGEVAGWASGATYSPTGRRMISMARVSRALAVPGTEVSVRWGGFSDEPSCQIRAEVVDLPFIKQHRKDVSIK